MRVGRPGGCVIAIFLLLTRETHRFVMGVIVMIGQDKVHAYVLMVIVRVMMVFDLHGEHRSDPIREHHRHHQDAAEKFADH